MLRAALYDIGKLILSGFIVLSVLALGFCAYIEFDIHRIAHTSTVDFGGGVSLKLDLYLLSLGEEKDSGDYLTLTTPQGNVRRMVWCNDWAHWVRMSVYRTDTGLPAVITSGGDWIAQMQPIALASLTRGTSGDSWTYLGAFDFEYVDRQRTLVFVPAAQQAECIPMAQNEDDPKWLAMRRGAARHTRCPYRPGG